MSDPPPAQMHPARRPPVPLRSAPLQSAPLQSAPPPLPPAVAALVGRPAPAARADRYPPARRLRALLVAAAGCLAATAAVAL